MVTPSKIKNPSTLHLDVLPRKTVIAFEKCAKMKLFSNSKWYLAGGTALALQIGHRRSLDLDFFTPLKTFDQKKIEGIMNLEGDWVTTSISEGTLYGEFFGAKVSFISYPFFIPSAPMRKHGTVSILIPEDIAVMKIIAISQRGKKRDFFDLYRIGQDIVPLPTSLSRVHIQYAIRQNITHILKALVFFEDAEGDPEPDIYFDANWKQVKKFFTKEVASIAEKLMK